MVSLRHSERRVIEEALDMGSGYVLRFSDRTFSEFFEDEIGIDIYGGKYSSNGSSKAKHMRAFIEIEDAHVVAKALRQLWKHRMELYSHSLADGRETLEAKFFEVVARIESSSDAPLIDAIERFKADATLDELVAAIERDIGANKPVAALDRLHTYCMKKFAHLLDLREIPWESSEPLHSRAGKYVRALAEERKLRDVTVQILKNSIGVFDKFNHVRNNQSLAHDNQLLDSAEARFIYDSITALLRFVKAVEAGRFES